MVNKERCVTSIHAVQRLSLTGRAVNWFTVRAKQGWKKT